LEIKGSITVTGGDAETQSGAQSKANAAQANAISTAGSNATTALNVFSGSLGAMAAISSINAGNVLTYIGEGAIVTSRVATNLILSPNYSASVEAGNFSDRGTFISLADGTITTPGFALKSDGTAYFKGVLNSSQATFGAWTLNAQAFFITANSRIKLDAVEEQIQVLDSNGVVRFTANTALTLPNPAGIQPTSGTPNESGGLTSPLIISPTATTIVSETSTNGNNNFFYTGVYHELGTFFASANVGQHNISYTWNPSNVYASGRASAAGNAYASISTTLVLTTDGTNDIVAYGTSDYAAAYGQMIGDDYYGGGGFGGGYYAQENTDYLQDPKTFTLSANLIAPPARYSVKLLVTYVLSVDDTSGNPFYESSYGSVVYEEAGAGGRLVIEAVSAGTIANGGGFQTAAGANKYLKHATSPDVAGIYTYAQGGLMADKFYHPSSAGFSGYNVAGYPVVKGYGRWTMVNNFVGTPGTPSVQTIGGCITSLVANSQGNYSVNYTLPTSDGGASTTTPSIFVFGTRRATIQEECTISVGKFTGNDTFTNFRTQDNNTDTLNNMNELSIIVVM
jgi:hypothetical protein